LFQYGEPQESSHAPLSLVTSGWMAHLSSAFMLYAGNYSFIREQKGLYSPGETGPKLGVFVSFFSFFFSPAPQICVSHINFAQNGKTHVVGSKAKSRYWRLKEREEQGKGSLFLLQRAKTIALKGQECFYSFLFSRNEIKAVST